MKKKILILLPVVIVLVITALIIFKPEWGKDRDSSNLHDENSKYAISYSLIQKDFKIDSPQAFVYNVSNDTIIFTKGHNKVVRPGSTTKLLTALYSLTVLTPEEIITPKDELKLVKEGSSIAYIHSGHKLSVEMLIEGMMLPSGNDAAYVLAAAVGRRLSNNQELDGERAIDAFLSGMSEYAKEIGLCGTNFISPDGYSDETHYTTTEDMLIISKLALENKLIRKYASLTTDDVVYASGHINTWHNTNKLIDKESAFYSEHAVGLKTGSLDDEYSLIFAFRFDDGREYIAGVFGAKNKNTRYKDALEIIEELENNP